jgi:4-amino-4-deoxychorismate lyase
MPRFIESIKLLDGALYNLNYHQERVNKTFEKFFPQSEIPDLQSSLNEVQKPIAGLFKCRIVYDQTINSIEFTPYQMKSIQSLKIVQHDEINYEFKFENRDGLNELYNSKQEADDILIIKNGMVTDSSYANLIFKLGEQWITPASYLLNGTMRQQLIESGEIQCEPIALADIRKFDKLKLINSMVGMNGSEIEMANVIF